MRYLRLYLYFLRFSFSKAMEFRVDFFFRIIMDCIYYLIQFAFFQIIYLHTPLLGGWNQEQMSLFIASFIFVDALYMTVFSNNAWWFPISINRGDLDYYLTKPASSFFFLGFKEFAANSFLNLILSIGILAYFLININLSFDLFKTFIFILLLCHGSFLYYMTYLVFILPVFWTHSPRGFSDIYYTAEKVYQRPDGIFAGYFKRFFITILPFSLMASYPVRYLLQDNTFEVLTEMALGSLVIYSFVFVLWRKGIKSYSSASS